MSTAFLLDTHALLWWAHQPTSLSPRVADVIGDPANLVFVSPVSAIEIATKHRKGKLEFDSRLASDFVAETVDDFRELPVSAGHAQLAGAMEGPHDDPWDRLLAAQARIEGLTLITRDRKMAGFGVATLW